MREWLRKEATDTTLISSLAEAQDPTATNTMLKEQSMGLIAEALSAFAGDRGKVVGLMSHHLAREICNLLEKNAFFNSTRAKAFTLITNLVESPSARPRPPPPRACVRLGLESLADAFGRAREFGGCLRLWLGNLTGACGWAGEFGGCLRFGWGIWRMLAAGLGNLVDACGWA